MDQIPFHSITNIVEFGAGTGTITLGLLEQMSQNQHLYAYEINQDFINYLQAIKDPKLSLLVEDAGNIVHRFGKNSVDVVVSSLPLKNMPLQVKRPILIAAHDALKPGGMFIQYQYSLGDFALVKSIFGDTKLEFTPLNIPPAFVYFSRKA